jgi:hypothetical protein
VSDLTEDDFLREYVRKNRPVVIREAMANWPALERWTPADLEQHLGTERVQVYGDLFRLVELTTLSKYLGRHFGRGLNSEPNGSVPYVRWYCHLSNDERVPWADHIFERISRDWSAPAFFPKHSFALPYCNSSQVLDPSRHWFPAKGLFISGQGGRTRLHVDPWCSDALLCQIYGRKEFVMYDPGQAAYLSNGQRCVDVENPDLDAFPQFGIASPAVRDVLEPGEMVLVPAGWYHHFKSLTDSVSLTWNFVHVCRLPEFLAYLGAGPADAELKQLAYAYFESPGHNVVDSRGFAQILAAAGQFSGNRAM